MLPPIFQLIVFVVCLSLAWIVFSKYVLPVIVEPFRTVVIVVLALLVIWFLLNFAGMAPSPWPRG